MVTTNKNDVIVLAATSTPTAATSGVAVLAA
jgi:hypothetical protein